MASKDIYEIEVLGWDKHNGGGKTSKWFKLYNRFFDDVKIASLPSNARLLYLCLLCECSSSGSRHVVVHLSLLACHTGVQPAWVGRYIAALEENRLVIVQKRPLDKIRLDKNREDKITSAGVEKRPPSAEVTHLVTSPDRGANKRIWEAYRESYFQRYRVEPVRNAKVNTNIAQFAARVGADDAVEIVKFYLSHSDGFYLKNTHSFSLCLKDAESLRTQWLKGRAITQTDIRRVEQRQQQADLMASIERGEV